MNTLVLERLKTPTIRATLFLELFYFAYFLKMLIGFSSILALLTNGAMLICGFLSLYFIIREKKQVFKEPLFIFIIGLLSLGVVSSSYTGNYEIGDYLLPIAYFGIGLILIHFQLDFKIIRFFFLFYVAFFFINMLVGIHPDHIFTGFSRNAIPVFMLIQIILVYISFFQSNKKLPLYPSVIAVIISFWCIGRSGIIISFLLLFSITFIRMKDLKKVYNKKNLLITSLIVIIGLVIITFTPLYDSVLGNAISRIQRLGFLDPHRGSIIKEYYSIASSSIWALLFGVPIYGSEVFAHYGNNLHNSYLRLHSLYGISGVVVMFYFIIRGFVGLIKGKNLLFLFLLALILVRMLTDIVAFHGPFDPILYFLLYFSISTKKHRISNG